MLYFIKLLYAWLMPPGLFVLVLLVMCWRYRKTDCLLKILSVIVLIYLFSIGAFSNQLIKPLENYYPQPAITELKDAQVIVILGGGSYGGVPDFDGQGQLTGGAANRHFKGLRLQRALNLPLIISGGMVFQESGTESDNASRLLKACGVEEKYILIDSKSRNTVENAKNTKEICRQKGFQKVILITSAYHMPRSVALFKREGVDVIPYPADYTTNVKLLLDAFAFTPNHRSLSKSAIAIKEYLGLLALKMKLQ